MKIERESVERWIALLLLLLFLAPLVANSEVDLRSLAFVERSVDLDREGEPVLVRTYSSRALGGGLFGLGWCAPWEQGLEPPTDDSPGRLFACGEPRATFRAVSKDSWRSELPGYRGLERTREGFLLVAARGPSRLFDRTGRLIEIRGYGPTEETIRVERGANGQALSIRSSRWTVRFERDALGRVVRATTADGRWVAYEWDSQGLLARSRRSDGSEARYAYDSDRNLISLRRFDGSTIRVRYSASLDAVARIERSDGCEETYSAKPRHSGFVVDASLSCGSAEDRRPQRRRERRTFCRIGGSLVAQDQESCG